jgi:hypothetical protein
MMMKFLTKGTLVTAAVGALIASTYGCDQPKPKCAAGRGAFVAVYKNVSGPADCAKLKGETLGFSTYNATGPNEGKPNLDIASIAIQSENLGVLVDTAESAGSVDKDPTHKPYGLGFFSTAEPQGDFCTVPTLTVATQSIPEVAADPANEIEASPATTVSYAWSNVKLYVTAAALGTQFTADLTLTTDGVACGYQVLGMYQFVSCSKDNPADPTSPLPDERDCSPDADESPSVTCTNNAECFSNVCEQGLCRCTDSAGCCADKDVQKCELSGNTCAAAPAEVLGAKTCHDAPRPTGSGINPDFPTKCDPDLLACVLTKDTIPALK